MADEELVSEPDNSDVMLMVQMRIYDAVMGIFEAIKPDWHERLEALHERGGLVYGEVKYDPEAHL